MAAAQLIVQVEVRICQVPRGATAVQVTPIVAETAEQLFVFQRSPHWCPPLGNHPISAAEAGVTKTTVKPVNPSANFRSREERIRIFMAPPLSR